MLMWPNARPRAATMSRSRFAVTGLTWVAAHLVIGETTRSRAAPRAMSESIQSCSLLADAQRSIHGIAEKIGEKFRNELASLRLGHPLAHQYPAVLGDRQDSAFRV